MNLRKRALDMHVDHLAWIRNCSGRRKFRMQRLALWFNQPKIREDARDVFAARRKRDEFVEPRCDRDRFEIDVVVG